MDNKNQAVNGAPNAREEVNTLVSRAREGSQDAFTELKKRYKPLLESQTEKHRLSDMTVQDVEDLRQEALVIFCNAICNYDCSTEGVEFGLYAKICIENGLVSFVRSYQRRRNVSVLPLEYAMRKGNSIGGSAYDPLRAFTEKERTEELVRLIRTNLSEYENRVWWLYVSGMTVSEIVRTVGDTDAKSVSNAVYRIRKKLRSILSDRI